MRQNIILICFMLFSFVSIGQTKSEEFTDSLPNESTMQLEKGIALITGYQLNKFHFAELGIGFISDGTIGTHPSTVILGYTNEFKISQNFIWGQKIGLWMGGGVGGMNLGLNFINYTDFKSNSIRFRPEIGFGFGLFRIVYGYNFAITNKNFEGINKHSFSLNIIPKLKMRKY